MGYAVYEDRTARDRGVKRWAVYGYGGVSVGETAWVHNSYDEECDCEYCEKERSDE